MVTPEEITKKVAGIYGSYLRKWVCNDDANFFPHPVRGADLKRDKLNKAADIQAIRILREKAKPARGWGYTLEERYVAARDGHDYYPQKIWIDTRDDLLRLTRKASEFAKIQTVVERLRGELPDLETWLARHVKSLAKHHESLDGLIAVTKYFLAHPMPGCYPQQLPVDVDAKFIDRNHRTLRAWLDLVLPPAAIDVHEQRFARRFGLREVQHHRGLVVLDEQLHEELDLPFDELSAPARSLAQLEVSRATIVIVENKVPLTTVPRIHRGIAVAGDGASAWMLEQMPWLHTNCVLYWGDIDAPAFEILSRLREAVPGVESVLMDRETFDAHATRAQPGKGRPRLELPALTDTERAMYEHCVRENLMLEQEKLSQRFVGEAFARTLAAEGGRSDRQFAAP